MRGVCAATGSSTRSSAPECSATTRHGLRQSPCVVFPAQILHHLVQATVPEDAVLVRTGAGRPLRADVHAEQHVAGPAGRDAPVPERPVRPDAASPVLHGEAGARIEVIAAVACAHFAFARQRRVLRIALEARRAPRHHDVEALVTGRPAHREGGGDLGAAVGATAEMHREVGAVDAIVVVDAAGVEGDVRLDRARAARSVPARPYELPAQCVPSRKSVSVKAQNEARSMSASVTENTKSGAIQFQKFHFFLRGQWPARFARTSGWREKPTAAGFRRPRASQRSTGAMNLALGVDGLAHAARAGAVEDREMVGQRRHRGLRDGTTIGASTRPALRASRSRRAPPRSATCTACSRGDRRRAARASSGSRPCRPGRSPRSAPSASPAPFQRR